MHYGGYLCNTSRCNQTKQTKVSTERVNQYLDFLIDPSFPGVNRFFVLPFEDVTQRTSDKQYYIRTREMKNYNVMIDGQNFLH